MLIQTAEELDELLAQLRIVRSDHQWVEAKRARNQLPQDLWKTLSAFANDGGGVVLLGVDEQSGFAVSGVADPGRMAAELQALCSRAEPPLRPAIDTVVHPDGVVVVAQVAAVPRTAQPCHFPEHGTVHQTSFIRVGDGDVQLQPAEVDDILAARSPNDFSRRSAPDDARLSPAAVETVFGADGPDRDLELRRAGVVNDGGQATLGGWLALGEHPQTLSPLARVSCLREPRAGDPSDARQRGAHVEGTVGELLDGVLGWLDKEMGTVQVARDGNLFDELDFPREALREALSNALMHRSLSQATEATSISVRLTDDTVAVISPGGLHPGLDPRQLGLTPLSTPRNYTLVRLCGRVTTPAGARLVEAQASGIARSDRLCRQANTAPLLLVVRPAQFTAFALRGRLDDKAVAARRPRLAKLPNALRIVSFLSRLQEVRDQDPSSLLHEVSLDAVLTARLLAPSLPEHVTAMLDELVEAKVLVSRPRFDRVTWELAAPAELAQKRRPVRKAAPEPAARISSRRRESVAALLRAVAASPTGELRPRDASIGLADRALRATFSAAERAGLIEATTASVHSPNRAYRLTDLGRRQLGADPDRERTVVTRPGEDGPGEGTPD